MKIFNIRSISSAATSFAGLIVAASAYGQPSQGGYGPGNGMGPGMMGGNGGGWMGGWMGGYGGIWLPILVVAAFAGLVIWVVSQNKK